MYGGLDRISRANPKSAIFTSSGPMQSRFSGFKSRWKKPGETVEKESDVSSLLHHPLQLYCPFHNSCNLNYNSGMTLRTLYIHLLDWSKDFIHFPLMNSKCKIIPKLIFTTLFQERKLLLKCQNSVMGWENCKKKLSFK